ncbi:methylase involved in ubiquinone/menaquinone biosynthesis [Thaumarchaeota archaeon SCGC AB-539-E09]|nr:methylase involved in ubiquinone/menaquinone biosynthesis [Thaumarchaeota archaeon SCGC AB-539-E09]
MLSELDRKKIWDDFWKKQSSSGELIPTIIRWGRYYFSLIYVKFIRKHYIGSSILETGCGSAESTLLFARDNENIKDIVLLDFSSQSIKVSRKKSMTYGIAPHCILGDIFFIPLKHSSLDFVWNLGLLEHFDNPIPIIREMVRVSREGGRVVGIVPYKYAPIIFMAFLLKPFTRLTKGYDTFQTWEEAKQLWSPREYIQKFKEAGLKRVKVYIIFESFFFNMVIMGNKKRMK